jgi:hypothetical protein
MKAFYILFGYFLKVFDIKSDDENLSVYNVNVEYPNALTVCFESRYKNK